MGCPEHILTSRKQVELLEESNEHTTDLRAHKDGDIRQIEADMARTLQHLLDKK